MTSDLYDSARTLATVEHLGVKFRMVRRRFPDRKSKRGWHNWRGMTCLLYQGMDIAPSRYINGQPRDTLGNHPGTIEDNRRMWKEMLERYCPKDRKALDAQIALWLAKRSEQS